MTGFVVVKISHFSLTKYFNPTNSFPWSKLNPVFPLYKVDAIIIDLSKAFYTLNQN